MSKYQVPCNECTVVHMSLFDVRGLESSRTASVGFAVPVPVRMS